VCKCKDDYQAVISFSGLVHDPRQGGTFSIGVILVNYKPLVQEGQLPQNRTRRWSLRCSWSFRLLILIPAESPYAAPYWWIIITKSWLTAHTIYQLLHSICQIITFDRGVHLVNAFVLGNLFEQCRKSHIVRNWILLGYISVADSLGANLPHLYSALCWRPVTHAQTWASYSALYRFGRLS